MELGDVHKIGAYVPISNELLYDYTNGEMGTPPKPRMPIVPTRKQRIVRTLRHWRWLIGRVPGYRLVHKDDLYDPDE